MAEYTHGARGASESIKPWNLRRHKILIYIFYDPWIDAKLGVDIYSPTFQSMSYTATGKLSIPFNGWVCVCGNMQ